MSKTDLAWAASHTGTSVVLVAPLNWCVRVSHAADVCLAVCQLHWAARRAHDAPSFAAAFSAGAVRWQTGVGRGGASM